MPITELLVEGKIDAEIINRIIAESEISPIIRQGGTKNGLSSTVMNKRRERKCNNVYFIRDRDFDYDIDVSETTPQQIIHRDNGINTLLGWHWCRHEIENYMLEPGIVSRALGVTINEVTEEILKAALSIRFYQAARWTIGVAKRKGILPPPFDLCTKPKHLAKKEFAIIDDCSNEECLEWIKGDSEDFLSRVEGVLNESVIVKRYQEYVNLFSDTNCKNLEWVLHTFSGKDLFTALSPWFLKLKLNHPSEARDKIRLWVVEHAVESIALVAEWGKLLGELRVI